MSLLSVIGSFGLIFRIWLCEIKVKDVLGYRRGLLSRMTNLYFFIAMILDFRNEIFNFIIVIALPLLIIGFFINDIPAYREFNELYGNRKDRCWILTEGLTLHPPMIITGIVFYLLDLKTIFPKLNPISVIVTYILLLFPFILLDKRWLDGELMAFWMFIGALSSLIGVVLFVIT